MVETTRKAPQQFDREVDVRGFNCPMPALRARAALAHMKKGQVLRVVSTDRNASRDFHTFARKTGHELLAESVQGKDFVFYFRKA